MAFPTILFDNSAGSDTAASGAGPTVAITGSDASTDGTGLIVTLPNADLSGVDTTGLHALWLQTASGRQWGRITAKASSGTAIANVTVQAAYSTGLTSQTYAIGGKRSTFDNADSRKLFVDQTESGWVISPAYTGSDYTISSTAIPLGATSSVITRLTGTGTTRPTIRQTANAACFTCGTTNSIIFTHVKLCNSHASRGIGISYTRDGGINIIDCELGDATNKLTTGIDRTSFGGGSVTIINSEVHHCTGRGLDCAQVSGMVITGCWIHDNGSDGVNTGNSGTATHSVYGNIFSTNGAAGYGLSQGTLWLFANNICTSNTTSGLVVGNNPGSSAIIINNQFTNNTQYGINFTTAGTLGISVDCNNFFGNTLGAKNASSGTITAGDHDTALDPQYGNSAIGNYAVGANMVQKGYPIATNYIGNGTSGTKNYSDLGFQTFNSSYATISGLTPTFKGVDIRQTTDRLIFRTSLSDLAGVAVSTGATSLAVYELQSDGSLKTLDWNDFSFKSTACLAPSTSMTHRTGNNSTVNTGIWTSYLSGLTGFTKGAVYIAQISSTVSGAVPQTREFQFGSLEGDRDDGVVGSVTGTPSSSSFVGSGSALSSTDDFYKGSWLYFTSGTLRGLCRKVSGYTGSSKTFAFSGASTAADAAFPSAPASSDTFVILGRSS